MNRHKRRKAQATGWRDDNSRNGVAQTTSEESSEDGCDEDQQRCRRRRERQAC